MRGFDSSPGRAGIAGNAKMRGKRWRGLSCRCCDIRNLKPDYIVELEKREAKDAMLKARDA